MSEIRTSGPLLFTEPNNPTRVGEIINSLNEIYDIPMPRLGMSVYVKDEGVNYTITKLEPKLIEGILVPDAKVAGYELQTGKSIAWNSSSNVNDYVVAGVYNITGERLNADDGLPIANSNPGHTISARLVVLDSSITGTGDSQDKCITQVLTLSNRTGEDGNMYIRTGHGVNINSLSWKPWATLQTNINIGQVENLDNLTDNGIYSGVWTGFGTLPLTFVCVVINDYFVGVNPRRISQFVYGLSKLDGSTVYQSRVWDDSKNAWSDWEILNQKEISSMIFNEIKKVTDGVAPEKLDSLKDLIAWVDAHGGEVAEIKNDIQANATAITKEVNRAKNAEGEIQQKTIELDSMTYSNTLDDVSLEFTALNGQTTGSVTLPAATTMNAGVMSAEDKKKLLLFKNIGAVTGLGIDTSVETFRYTDFLPIPPEGLTIKAYDGGTQYNYSACAFYREDGMLISALKTQETTGGIREFTLNKDNIPDGAAFIVVSTKLSSIKESYVSVGLGDAFDATYTNRVGLTNTRQSVDFLYKGTTDETEATYDEDNFIVQQRCIGNTYNLLGSSKSIVYAIVCDGRTLIKASQLSNVDNVTKCYAVYHGSSLADIKADNVIMDLSDTQLNKRFDISVDMIPPAGTVAVFAANIESPVPIIKLIRAKSSEIENLIDGEAVVSIKYNGSSREFTKLDNFVINTAGGSSSNTYETFYLRATKKGEVRVVSKGGAAFVRLAIASSIGEGKPEYYQYSDNLDNVLSVKKGQLICVSANIGKTDWLIEYLVNVPRLTEFVEIPQMSKLETRTTGLEVSVEKLHNDNKNAYKGLAPKPFRDKLLACEKDIDVVLFGDSVTALTNVGEELPDAANLPAGCQHYAITYMLWRNLCKNKQQCDRFDSTVNTFAENGSFAISDVSKQNGTETNGNYGEFSVDNCLYRETSTPNDSFSFEWNLDDFEKLNLIGRMSIYGSRSITISCDNGKVLVQHNDRANQKDGIEDNAWVEANGYNFTQYLDYSTSAYDAWYLRNFPIKFKRAEGATGIVTITVTNTCNDSDVNEGNSSIPSTTMFYWGTERWNNTTVRITNCARAGRSSYLLHRNMKQELSFRDIDLVIWQLPLWNELKVGGNPLSDIAAGHELIIDDLKTYSENFSKFQVIVNMVHTQLASWVGNTNIQFQANGLADRPKTDLTDWECCSKLFKNILDNENYSKDKLVAANLYNEVYNYAQANRLTMQELLDTDADSNIGDGTLASGSDSKAFTTDGTHPSSYGFDFYASLITPMMYGNGNT